MGFHNCRVMVDVVAHHWTVVLEAEFESLGDFEGHMASFGKRHRLRCRDRPFGARFLHVSQQAVQHHDRTTIATMAMVS